MVLPTLKGGLAEKVGSSGLVQGTWAASAVSWWAGHGDVREGSGGTSPHPGPQDRRCCISVDHIPGGVVGAAGGGTAGGPGHFDLEEP